ncbi:hypothetical protein [Chondromyces crocatus]|uniref:Uncharacterized protein n=1 Tax=Chondromyces crocatus TaxID=52 RepID=A0A0K1EHF7_CHOCO|nr:hypothetical protein [Chondromyces crocatus]AKT40289.1 uncharacterized protein CMC5_044420 [Chondromyces crocatus]
MSSSTFFFLRRQDVWSGLLTALIGLGGTACGGGAAPPSTSPPVPAAPALPEATAVEHAEPSTPSDAAPSVQSEVVIHHADIHGKIKARAGKRLLVEPLVVTSRTLPVKGNKANLYRVVEPEGGEVEMLLIAEANVALDMEMGKSIALDIVDEKKDVLVSGRKTNHYIPGTKVLLRYEW